MVSSSLKLKELWVHKLILPLLGDVQNNQYPTELNKRAAYWPTLPATQVLYNKAWLSPQTTLFQRFLFTAFTHPCFLPFPFLSPSLRGNRDQIGQMSGINPFQSPVWLLSWCSRPILETGLAELMCTRWWRPNRSWRSKRHSWFWHTCKRLSTFM